MRISSLYWREWAIVPVDSTPSLDETSYYYLNDLCEQEGMSMDYGHRNLS